MTTTPQGPMSPKLANQMMERPLNQFRLSPEAFNALKKKAPKIGCPTTELEAGYLLGIQFMLELIRDGFTVE